MTPEEDRFDWVESVTRLAGMVGMNPVRVRWKLRRWQEDVAQRRGRAVATVKHVGYAHQTCPQCGKVLDRSERRCPGCGRALGGRVAQLFRRAGLMAPSVASASTVLTAAILLVYARMIIVTQGQGLLGFDSETLLQFGAHLRPYFDNGDWWRPATAIFLHMGVMHLGFNVLALMQVGPTIEEIFGHGRMLTVFMVTGIVGFFAGDLLHGATLTAGASGAIMGLCGMAAGWGQKDGTTIGRTVRNRMLQWVLYATIFGFVVNANHGAHFGGFIAGAAFGFSMRPQKVAPASSLMLVLGGVLALATVVLVMLPMPSRAAALFADEETPGAEQELTDNDELAAFRVMGRLCHRVAAGSVAEVFRGLSQEERVESGATTPEELRTVCGMFAEQEKLCADVKARGMDAYLRVTFPDATAEDRRTLERTYGDLCHALESFSKE